MRHHLPKVAAWVAEGNALARRHRIPDVLPVAAAGRLRSDLCGTVECLLDELALAAALKVRPARLRA